MSLSVKDPAEKVVISFDFSAITSPISGAVLVIKEKGTEIDLSGTMFSGVSQTTGNIVKQMVQGGESGKQYDIRCQVDIAATGERFVAKDTLPVKTL
jgi:hypothetical protein